MKPYTLYVEELPANDNLSRHEREKIAVDKLVKRAFGPGARKYNMPSGAPAIEGANTPFSISHCRTHAALVAGHGCAAIGADIEIFRPTLRRVVHKFLTEAERHAYCTDEALLQAWTLKEAVYKAALTPGLALAEIHLPPLAEAREGGSVVARGVPYTIVASHSTGVFFISIVVRY